jgi:hypothetical protein
MMHLIKPAVRAREEPDWSEEALSAEMQVGRWTRRLRISERLAMVASFPLAYLAVAGPGIRSAVVQAIVSLWGLTLLSTFICSTVIAHAEGRVAGLPRLTGPRRLPPDRMTLR